MKRRVCLYLVSLCAIAAFLLLVPTPIGSPGLLARDGVWSAGRGVSSGPFPNATKARVISSYGKLPLSFEPNQGQASDEVEFLSRGPGYALFLTDNQAVLSLESVSKEPARTRDGRPGTIHQPASADTLHMTLAGASSNARLTGLDELPGKSNYFIGNDPKTWHTNVPTYAKVRYQDVYPGIDLVYYGNQRQLEYDFVVAPGADPKAITLEITGTSGTAPARLAENGDLVIKTGKGEVRLLKPVVYQAESSEPATSNRESIKGGFVLLAKNRVGFEVSSYDTTKPLVIDPVLSYSTFLGGTESDTVWDIAVDESGNVYATGETQSMDFPVANPLQTNFAGGTCSDGSYMYPCPDVFVSKLNAAGDALVFSTFLGGGDYDAGYGIAVGTAGNIYVTGETSSSDFPVINPINATYGGGGDLFVAQLSSTGSPLLFSSYCNFFAVEGLSESGEDIAVDSNGTAFVAGQIETDTRGWNGLFLMVSPPSALSISFGGLGTDDDWAQGIALGANDEVYVVGTTRSADFYTSSDAYQPTFGGGTCGTEPALPCPDAFIRRFVPDIYGDYSTDYSSYLGGANIEYGDAITVDSMGRIYVVGETWSANFPTTTSAYQTQLKGDTDAFVTRLSNGGSTLDYSTYLGGEYSEEALAVAVDGSGNAVVTGNTASQTFPTVNPIQATLGGELATNAFVTKFNSAGSALAFSTYLGATGSGSDYVSDSGNAVGLDASGNIYVAGRTSSASFPTVSALQSTYGGAGDGFIARIYPAGLGISPTSLDFSQGVIGGTSSAKVVTLNNADTAPVSINNIAASGDFHQTNTCGSSVAAGSSCTINVTFTPTATGTRTGELTVTTGVAGTLPPVSLTGTGTDFAVQPASGSGTPSATVAAGATATYDLSVVPEGFSGNVAMDCTWNGSQPRGTACSVSPATVNVNGTDPASATVSITTTAQSMVPVGWEPQPPAPNSYPVSHLVMWLLGLGALASLALRRRRTTVALASILFMVVLWTACGGDGNPPPPPPTPTGTPAGTYSLTVTGTASGATKSTDVTLIVQ